MDASTILSRLQFAFTASYHYLFPQLTMGLALLLLILKSLYLGIFLFGEQTFGQKIHWFSTFMVWLGTWASGAFIIVSNAWMQHPVGYTSVNGRLHIANYWAVLFNPWIIGIVLAVIYFIFTYRLFWGKIQVSDTGDHE